MNRMFNKPMLLAILHCFHPWQNLRSIFIRSSYRFAAIDGIRGLSMLYILMTHAFVVIMLDDRLAAADFIHRLPWYLKWLVMGDKAVDGFFVLSGFLIARLLMLEFQRQGSIQLSRFYARRWLRLTPVYWVFLLIFSQFLSEGANKDYLWAYAFYLNNFLDEANRYIPWLWSLAAEEQFYLIFPLLLVLVFKLRVNLLVFLANLIVLSLLIRWTIVSNNPHFLVSGDALLLSDAALNTDYNQQLYINLYSRFGPFVIGVFCAYLHVYKQGFLAAFYCGHRAFLLTLAFIVMALIMLLMPVYQGIELPEWLYYLYHVMHRHWFATMIALLIMMSFEPRGINRLMSGMLSSRFLYPFANLSYAMYLFHLPILFLSYQWARQQGMISGLSVANVFLLTVIALVPLLLVSLLLFLAVEKPFIRLRDIKRELIR